jgi:hypothetical protein
MVTTMTSMIMKTSALLVVRLKISGMARFLLCVGCGAMGEKGAAPLVGCVERSCG